MVAPDAASAYEFSPSQVETYLTCARKWAWRKIGRVETPEHDSAKLGTEVHLQLENYLSGKPLDFSHEKGAGYIAAAGVHFLPDPDSAGKSDDEIAALAKSVHIENAFRFVSPTTGFVWNGRMDLELEDSRVLPGLLEELVESGEPLTDGPVPAVLDHKSTSSLRWAKTPDDLRWDVQANVYAHVLLTSRRVLVADLVWVYYQTKGARAAKRTHLRVASEWAAQQFERIERVATEMAHHLANAAIERKLDAEVFEGPPNLRAFVQSLPPNPNACSKFGGCPYQHVCQLTIAERMKATMSDVTLDTLRARASAEDGSPVPVPVPVMGMSDRDVPAPSGLPSWLSSPSAPAAVTPAPMPVNLAPAQAATLPLPLAPPAASSLVFPEPRRDAPADVAINPPEASLPLPVLPPDPPTVPAINATSEEPQKKGGRPKGSKNKAKDESVVVNVSAPPETSPAAVAGAVSDVLATYTATDEEAAETLADKADEDDAFPGDGFALYVDCAPCCSYTPIETYIARAKEVIRSTDFPDGKGGSMRVSDYRYLPFGQGAGALANAVLAEVVKAPPVHLVTNTKTPEGQIVLADLVATAAFVVRAAA